MPPGTERFSGFGRAVDVEGDGTYGNRDGLGTKTQPARSASIALRDGLRQTALDNMALIRAIRRGVDVDGDGSGTSGAPAWATTPRASAASTGRC